MTPNCLSVDREILQRHVLWNSFWNVDHNFYRDYETGYSDGVHPVPLLQKNKKTNKQTNKQTHKQKKQTNKQTKKQKNKQTNKQTNKQKNKENNKE